MFTRTVKLAIASVTILIVVVLIKMYSEAKEEPRNVGISPKKEVASPAQLPNAGNVSGSFQKQVLDLETYLAEHPQDTTHLVLLAHLYQDAHQPQKASPFYKRLLAIQKKNTQHWLDYITVLGEEQKWNEAESVCLEMLGLFDDESAKYNLGAIYANQGRFADAKKTWEEILISGKADSHVTHLVSDGLKQLAQMK
ncbi:hypothetical protein EP331_11830 [bacterium]|nr:MAG: hypothetical protein EP331_11830 [bacterium]